MSESNNSEERIFIHECPICGKYESNNPDSYESLQNHTDLFHAYLFHDDGSE